MTHTKKQIIKKLHFLLEKYNLPFMNLLVTAICLHRSIFPNIVINELSTLNDTDVLKALEAFEDNLKGLKRNTEEDNV
ncbi:MAG: hypothetical protein DRO67_07145 [Candidatus Asgardarchaeum californiense]|nr:MAG: hypothetical protein DRO67_07145 [Candidatus Asgardarchaeum californiense]